MTATNVFKSLLLLSVIYGLSACNSENNNSSNNDASNIEPIQPEDNPTVSIVPPADTTVTIPSPATSFTIGLLPDTQGGSDNQGQSHVAMHPLSEVLKHQKKSGVDMVIALGDLTDGGSALEFSEWRSIADDYAADGIEFLPVMGNHEMNYAYTFSWIENMKNFIPEDAIHMPSYEWINYYVIRDNVLIIGLAYYNLPIAFDWIKEVVSATEDQVDHIVVASHDGLIGAKYGLTREHIVDGAKDDNWVYDVQPQIRDFFAERDVIYVQGHEHQYQRSLISAKTVLTSFPSSSTPTGGNYRMDTYTQIMAGNASYKGYEFRYGERDLVQMIISQKNRTNSTGALGYDVNSSLLTFTDERVDYTSYFATHTAHSNDADQAFEADWKLMDKFSRTKNRCETVVYANSILSDTRPVLVLLPEYITNDCYGDDGSYASLAGGTNDTFNRTDSRTRDMSYTPGFTRAETLNDLVRLAYQWLFQVHGNSTPNLNSTMRVVPDTENQEMIFPETTIDLKEHVTLSWSSAQGTVSDILMISGTQNQTGLYQDDYGVMKDITLDNGLDLSQTDGGQKQPVILPSTATQSWDISDAVADAYAIKFTAPESIDATQVTLGIKSSEWVELAPAECIVDATWDKQFILEAPQRPDACEDYPLVGFDSSFGNRWWVVLNSDVELALIQK